MSIVHLNLEHHGDRKILVSLVSVSCDGVVFCCVLCCLALVLSCLVLSLSTWTAERVCTGVAER